MSEEASIRTNNKELATGKDQVSARETRKESFQKASSFEKITKSEYEKIEVVETKTPLKKGKNSFSKPDKKDKWNIRK